MITVVFWNLMGAAEENRDERCDRLRGHIAQLAEQHDVDLFVFAEPALAADDVANTLSQLQQGTYSEAVSECNRLQIITRFAPERVINQYDAVDGRLTIRRVKADTTEILLAAMHLHSKLYWTDTDQALQMTVVRDELVEVEETVGHQRTILVGDLNMNPFEPGVAGAQGLNAVMTRQLADVEARIVSQRSYPLLYNPMWGCFGDRTPGPPGTCFFSKAAAVNYGWNMFEQVLLRPALMHALDDLRILDSDGTVSFLTNDGRPRRTSISDHLPVLVRLKV